MKLQKLFLPTLHQDLVLLVFLFVSPGKSSLTIDEIKKQASSSKLSRREEAARLRRIRDKEREKEKTKVRWEGVFSGPGCIYDVYAGDADKLKGDIVVPPIV